jgi:hypothetical protein
MKLFRFSPRGQAGDGIELAQELAHHRAGVLALAELLELPHHARERVFGLRNRDLGVVLTLPLETLMMFEKFFPEEIGQTLARWPQHWGSLTLTVGRQATLQSHLRGAEVHIITATMN